MKNIKITRKITQGMYVLTTQNGGCIVDAVSQISSGDNPLIAVSVMKNNYTNELLKKNDKFALSVLGKEVDPQIIKTFGFNSMRDINIISSSLGYMICEKINEIDNDTHTLFVGRIIEADVYDDKEAMSYQYYQEHKNELLKITNEDGNTKWVCSICGYIYEGEELPNDFTCPVCGVGKDFFDKK